MPPHASGQRRLIGLLFVAMLVAPAAAQAQATPAPTASPLGEHVVAQWTVTNPSFIAFAFDSVWVTDHYGHTITRIDPVSNTVVAVIDGTGSNPEEVLEVGDALWVTGQNDDTTLIDPRTNAVIRTVKGHLLFMDHGFGSVWVTTRDNKLDRFDPATAEVTASIPLGDGVSDCMNDVVATTAAVWVISCDTGELIRIDPSIDSVVSRTLFTTLVDEATVHTQAPTGKGTDSVWLSLLGDESGAGHPSGLLRVDPITGTGLTFLPLIPAHSGDGSIAVTDEAVWLGGSGEINRVDVATNLIDATYPTAPGRLKVGVAFGSVWLRNFEQSLIQRLDVQP